MENCRVYQRAHCSNPQSIYSPGQRSPPSALSADHSLDSLWSKACVHSKQITSVRCVDAFHWMLIVEDRRQTAA